MLIDLSRPRTVFFLLALILASFLAVEAATMSRMGAQYDEVTDLLIARSFDRLPLTGSASDPTQARLPMVLIHLISGWTGLSLPMARFVSILMGLAALGGTFACARKLAGPAAGLLAALLLAVNPLFLEYARDALTESGIYETALGIWVCFLAIRLQRYRVSSVLGLGLLTGLLISSKFTGIALIPLGLVTLITVRREKDPAGAGAGSPLSSVWVPLTLLAAVLGLWLVKEFRPFPCVAEVLKDTRITILYAIAAGLWAAALTLLVRHRRRALTRPGFLLLVPLLGLSTALIVPPPHFCNSIIIESVIDRAKHSYLPFLPLSAKIFFLTACLLFKPGPYLGVLLLLSPLAALGLVRRAPRFLIPLAAVALWTLLTLNLDFVQVFYLMPLLPPASVLAASCLVALKQRRRLIAQGVLALCLAGTAVNLAACFPDFNLNGYQWLKKGAVAGFAPIGYGGMANVGYDGVVQCLRYVEAHAGPGDIVVSYFPYKSDHVVQYAVPQRRFVLIDGKSAEHKDAYRTADFVIATVEIETVAASPDVRFHPFKEYKEHIYDADVLRRDFTEVFAVKRAFGLTVATVWEKNGRTPPYNVKIRAMMPRGKK